MKCKQWKLLFLHSSNSNIEWWKCQNPNSKQYVLCTLYTLHSFVHLSIQPFMCIVVVYIQLDEQKQPKLEYILTKITFHRFVFDQQTSRKKINVSTSKNPFFSVQFALFISASSYSFTKFVEFFVIATGTINYAYHIQCSVCVILSFSVRRGDKNQVCPWFFPSTQSHAML